MRQIQIPEIVSVGKLAEALDIPVTGLIKQLMLSGIIATVNERIDFDTATLVLQEFMPEVELIKLETTAVASVQVRQDKRQSSDKATSRPPVVAVMGHVDHGKTSLLDAIRGSSVVEGESGGITQHISAYQIEHKDKAITFLDTPGHEAFAALRQHGASLTDIVIIVVAADDGVKPQTKEAIRFARQAKASIVVAINKIDKPAADINRVKQELATEKLMIEEWGGEVIAVEVSAKNNIGIDKLLDTVLLVAEVAELKADQDVPAEGIVIEAHMAQGRGAEVTVLVEHGVLKPGMVVTAGSAYGKIRTMTTTLGKKITTAGPSTPAILTGIKQLPQFADSFKVAGSEKQARAQTETYQQETGGGSSTRLNITSTEVIRKLDKQRDQQEIPVIIRADVQGSLTSVVESLQTLEHDEVRLDIIGTGVGNISEGDVTMAEATGAIIYGFNVDAPSAIKQNAQRKRVPIKAYKVIYELIDDAKEVMSSKLEPEVIENEVGRLITKGVFRITQKQLICGGEVTKGKIIVNANVRITRDDQPIGEAIVANIHRDNKSVSEVKKGEIIGLELKTPKKINLKLEDRLEFYTVETKQRSLEGLAKN